MNRVFAGLPAVTGLPAGIFDSVVGALGMDKAVVELPVGAWPYASYVPAYDQMARGLFAHLDLAIPADLDDELPFAPTDNDAAYEAIAAVAPEIAEAIDITAKNAPLAFWQRRFVRNALAWLAFSSPVAPTTIWPSERGIGCGRMWQCANMRAFVSQPHRPEGRPKRSTAYAPMAQPPARCRARLS